MINKRFRKYIAVALTILVLIGLVWRGETAEAAEKLRLSQTKMTLTVGESKTISVKNKKKNQTLIWSSSKKSVAVVSKKGRVTAKAPGQAVIKVKVGRNKKTLSCKVTVRAKAAVSQNQKISIGVGSKNFEAELYDNPATMELLERLPMTITMGELNGNEKYYYMNKGLPQLTETVSRIHTGDLMLYGSDCLVLFYKDFDTSYSYTRLGKISDPAGLMEALGHGSVKIKFSAIQK